MSDQPPSANFQSCDDCSTETHCSWWRRCLSECTPSDLGLFIEPSAQTRPATVELQIKDELPLPVRLRNLAQYAEDGPQSRMVTDMIALMREAADLLNRQSSPPVEGA
jgi:hypothetical protein